MAQSARISTETVFSGLRRGHVRVAIIRASANSGRPGRSACAHALSSSAAWRRGGAEAQRRSADAPVAFVGYSLGVAAAARAVEQLNQVMIGAEALPVRTQTLIPFVATAFDTAGRPTNPALDVMLTVMLDDLARLGHALGAARTQGTLLPPTLRIRNALAAAQQSARPS